MTSRSARGRRSRTRAGSARPGGSPTSTRSPGCTTAATSTRSSRARCARAHRYDRRLALVVFDLDDFKAINERIGHLAGDSVLAESGLTVAHRRARLGRSVPRRRRRIRGDPSGVGVGPGRPACRRIAGAAVSGRAIGHVARLDLSRGRRRAHARRRCERALRARGRSALPREGRGQSARLPAIVPDRARPKRGVGRPSP